jgi:hypothetical protein
MLHTIHGKIKYSLLKFLQTENIENKLQFQCYNHDIFYLLQTPALRAVGNVVTGNDNQTQVDKYLDSFDIAVYRGVNSLTFPLELPLSCPLAPSLNTSYIVNLIITCVLACLGPWSLAAFWGFTYTQKDYTNQGTVYM